MPAYLHRCDNGHEFDLILKFNQLEEFQHCQCGRPATRLICAPMVFVQKDICYDSPVDGRHITTKQARIEDLKRNGCIEYDPEMKTDYTRRLKENDERLDKQVEDTVEREFSQMPSRKQEKLAAEIQAGASVNIARTAPTEA